MYEINKLQHGKLFVRDFSHSLILYQKSHSFDFRYITNSCANPIRERFKVISILRSTTTTKKKEEEEKEEV